MRINHTTEDKIRECLADVLAKRYWRGWWGRMGELYSKTHDLYEKRYNSIDYQSFYPMVGTSFNSLAGEGRYLRTTSRHCVQRGIMEMAKIVGVPGKYRVFAVGNARARLFGVFNSIYDARDALPATHHRYLGLRTKVRLVPSGRKVSFST